MARSILGRTLEPPAVLLLHLLLGLCPGRYRRPFRAEVIEGFRLRFQDLLRDRGMRAAVRFAASTVFDLSSVAWGLHAENLSAFRRHIGNLRRSLTMQELIRDVRFGGRLFVRNPLLTVLMVATLALGIGVNATLYSGLKPFLLDDPPFPGGERMVRIFPRSLRDGEFASSVSYPNFKDFREQAKSFDGMVLSQLYRATFRGGDRSEIVFGEMVSPDYFQELRIPPAMGRPFDPESSQRVVVISNGLWKSRYGGDPEIIGKIVKVSGQPHTILGVAPKGFLGTEYGLEMDFWVPMTTPEFKAIREGRDFRSCDPPLARLREGVTIAEARQELETISAGLREAYPTEMREETFVPFSAAGAPFPPDHAQQTVTAGVLALGLVALVLLIACANVAGLLVARADARRREVGVRIALGAGRLRLIRQLLTESIMLGVAGGAAGLLLAYVAGRTLWTSLLPPLQYKLAVSFDPDQGVLVYTAVLTLGAALIFGLLPALRSTRGDLISPLKTGGGEAPRNRGHRVPRLRKSLVVLQVAVSTVLLVASALFLRSLNNFLEVDPGFRTQGLLLLSIDLEPAQLSAEQGRSIYSDLRERVRAMPGVQGAAWADEQPLDDDGSRIRVFAPGVHDDDRDALLIESYLVGQGYFDTMGIALERGRSFGPQDREDSEPVAVISRRLAERLWPGQSALDRTFRSGGSQGPERRVVGVVGDIKHHLLSERPEGAVYRPLAQIFVSSATLHVLSAAQPRDFIESIRREVARLNPDIPVFNVKSIGQNIAWATWLPRLGARLAAVFGAVATLLASVGLFGVLAHSASRRRREIGIRLAIGATRGNITRLLLRQGMSLVAWGAAAGVLAAIGVSAAARGLLFGVAMIDPSSFGSVLLLVAAVTVAACYWPIHRAVRLDPSKTLRAE